jgi:hypothetical protein
MGIACPRYGAAEPGRMNQDNFVNELDRLLSERLRETPDELSSAALGRVRRLTCWILKGWGRKPDADASAARDVDLIARIHTLPAHVQEALRRFYVFGEAEESIGFSMNMSPEEFHRVRLDVRDYILGRRARLIMRPPQS